LLVVVEVGAPAGCVGFALAAARRRYTRPVAIDVDVQRLQLGDVILIDLPEQGTNVEAKVVRDIEVVRELERTDSTVRATLRVSGRDDFVKEWPLDQKITLISGP
jgi:hypothetical protein